MITSIYENLIGITSIYCYDNGSVRDCTLGQKNIISTRYGELIPKYGPEEIRSKYSPSLSFYKSGTVKSIYLEHQADIPTAIGTFPAELVTFYESGSLKRLFPLNGKISGYWTEADEAELCQDFRFHFSFGSFHAKIINLSFFENGSLKAMSLWPDESVVLRTSLGLLPVKAGFSLFENGKIKSIEPAYEITVPTSIGIISAYDVNALGLCGDNNSLCFNENGNILSLTTSSSRIAVFNKDGSFETVEPKIRPDPLEDGQFTVVPLKISFQGHYVKFECQQNIRVYDINATRFTILNESIPDTAMGYTCGDCSKCSLCG